MSIQDKTRILANARHHLLKKRQQTLSLRARQEKGLSAQESSLAIGLRAYVERFVYSIY